MGLRAVNDPDEIRVVCEKVLRDHPQQVETYRSGKTKLLGFFIKQVMDVTNSGANPQITKKTLLELLG